MIPTLTDPGYAAPERRNPLDRLLVRLIRDERDLPFVHLSLSASLVLFPLAAAFFVPGFFRWWMAPIYWAILLGFFLDRFILMLHNTSHRPLFRKELGLMNHYIPWVLGPFFGETPETYFSHHVGMHHAENNLKNDLSSTLQYRRDSIPDFLRYFARFFFVGVLELSIYFARRRKWGLMLRAVAGESFFLVAVGLLLWLNPGAAVTVFVFPFLFVRMAMMAGNWAQHAFVDAASPANNYRNSITCINTRYNRRCYNDGYHISHHLRAHRHWTEHPEEFVRNVDRYRQERAIVFEGVDFFQVWMLLMGKRYETLARHMVDLGEPTTIEARIALLRERVQPVTQADPGGAEPAMA
jgi:fatty acid desaturase